MKRFLTIALSILLALSCTSNKKVIYLSIIENGMVVTDTVVVEKVTRKEKKMEPKFR